MGKYRRKHYAIEERLPQDIRENVDEMIKAGFKYREIVEYIKSNGVSVSKSAVQRYAANLTETLQSLRMTQENFRAIMEELYHYPDLDYTEAILRLLCGMLLEAVNKLPEEEKEPQNIDKIIKHTVALTRAAAYKRDVDIKSKTLLENGAIEYQGLIYEALRNEQPELYRQLVQFVSGINKRKNL